MGEVKGITSIPESDSRAELSVVLASPAFVRSPRMGKLLEYLCAKYFEGQADSIKEYSIAVEVLGRPESFDPAEDAIARVEVHRLRRKLREYYEQEGASNRLRIVIPSGKYTPIFLLADHANGNGQQPEPSATGKASPTQKNPPHALNETAPLAPAETPEDARPKQRLGLVVGSVLVLAALVGAGFLMRWRPVRPGIAAANRTSPPSGAGAAVAPAASLGRDVRILCGQRKPHTDRMGHVWSADEFFEGGSYAERPRRFMARTMDPAIFQNARSGDFSYRIPLHPGIYELHLYFAETVYGPGTSTGGGENSRAFNVIANGKTILADFDIVSDAGGAWVADERIFKDMGPAADGMLTLSFVSQKAQAMVSAIAVVPSHARHQNPIRIYTEENSYTDSRGNLWTPDNYWNGGQTALHGVPLQGTRDPDLFARERYGNFSYAIPAGEGEYSVTLYLVEAYWGAEDPAAGGVGRRVFDIECNGVALERNLDIFKEAGGASRALVKTFHGLHPSAQGKLLLSFVPVKNYASVYAIEVVDETR